MSDRWFLRQILFLFLWFIFGIEVYFHYVKKTRDDILGSISQVWFWRQVLFGQNYQILVTSGYLPITSTL